MTSSLELRNITKIFPDQNSGHAITAVENMSFSVKAGELVAVVGPSGCGKSTILNMVSGLYGATHGEVLIDGEVVTGTRPEVGFMLQKDLLLPWRTIVKNVEFGLEEKKMTRAERRERAMEELALRMSHCDRLYQASNWLELRKNCRSLIAIAEQVGLQKLANVAGDVICAIDQNSHVAIGATLPRLIRIGERSLTAIWDTQDVTL